jgi:hypothetical protein
MITDRNGLRLRVDRIQGTGFRGQGTGDDKAITREGEAPAEPKAYRNTAPHSFSPSLFYHFRNHFTIAQLKV